MLRSLYVGRSFRLAALLAVIAVPVACGGGDDNGGGTVDPDPIPGFVSGSVVDGSGNGVAGAALELSGDESVPGISSESDGTFLFSQVPAGSWTLSVTPPADFELAQGEPGSRSVTVEEGETAAVEPPFVLAAVAPPTDSGTVSVSVRADGAPEGGVDVKATLQGTATAAASGTTAANGTVDFDLGVGNYDIEITVPSGFVLAQGETNPKSATVTADQTTDVPFELITDTSPPEPDTVTIQLNSFSFSDINVAINVGDVIRWVNTTNTLHSITPDGNSEWTSVDVNTVGEEFFHTFDNAGTFDYICNYHISTYNMRGTIIVQ